MLGIVPIGERTTYVVSRLAQIDAYLTEAGVGVDMSSVTPGDSY